MRCKILTVDDSKTVRLIVRRAFRAYNVEIFEAANGVEGLAVAARESPDLILLDITMPVLNGMEMLARLKADPLLQGMAVMMLTAEGGRDIALKTAGLGVRDYLVKPVKADVLIEKCGRIIELEPRRDLPAGAPPIPDPAAILALEDEPALEPPRPPAQTVGMSSLTTKPPGLEDAPTRFASAIHFGRGLGGK